MGGEDSSQSDPSSREATGAEAWQCKAALGGGVCLVGWNTAGCELGRPRKYSEMDGIPKAKFTPLPAANV